MPPESSAFNPGLPQVFDAAGKSTIPSAVSPMQQKAPAMSQPGVQIMPQAGYNYPTMSANYQPSASFVLMSSNNGWSGQLPVQHTVQQN
jgi:hypothetical protein